MKIITIIIVIIIIIIIIIISIFKEDNVFSITASFPYGIPVNTDTDYYQTFFGLVAKLVVHMCLEKRSQCLPYNVGHQSR